MISERRKLKDHGIPPKDMIKLYIWKTSWNPNEILKPYIALPMVLVEDMGGNLSLESAEGKGAKFSVKIPLDVP